MMLLFDGKEFQFRRNESLLKMMETEEVVKQVFPTHGNTDMHLLINNQTSYISD